jgi:phospholipid transport system transporter-binding protein
VFEAGLAAVRAGQTEIDLAQLVTVDSSAVAVLLAWQRAARERGAALRFTHPSSSLQTLTRLYDVESLLMR